MIDGGTGGTPTLTPLIGIAKNLQRLSAREGVAADTPKTRK